MAEEQIYIEPFYELPLESEHPYGKDISYDLNCLVTNCIKHIPNPDIEKITRAFHFCVWAHRKIIRKSGEPYYIHPLKVALTLLRDLAVYDTASIISALLHDTIEDVEEVTYEIIEEKFGSDVAHIVDGATKIKGSATRQLEKASTYSKLFMYLVQDIRVILIKLADRLDNMKTLHHLKKEKQIAIATETLNFYVPFAQRLGLTKTKKHLEDLSLYFIDMNAFNSIHSALEEKRKVFIEYIRNFFVQVNQKLNEKSISHVITIEHKHIYEIFKMVEQGKELKNIDNFYSMVITLKTNDFSEAYRTYGIIASVFGPVSSLDDFIARPKINLYRALHSTHFGPDRKLIEVIIRTEEMDNIDERGIIGFKQISELSKPLLMEEVDVLDWIQWMQDLINSGEQDAIQQIWGAIKMNLYDDDMLIHTKDGDSFILPKGACPIDLAFQISDNKGMHCISAKVNDEIKSLDYELKNNDHVEIITSPTSFPSEEWRNFVITSKAVVKLHNYFKNQIDDEEDEEKEEHEYIKLKIKAYSRKNLLNDIKFEIGIDNIQRTYLHNFNSEFEALFFLKSNNKNNFNTLFTRLLSVKGIKSAERID